MEIKREYYVRLRPVLPSSAAISSNCIHIDWFHKLDNDRYIIARRLLGKSKVELEIVSSNEFFREWKVWT